MAVAEQGVVGLILEQRRQGGGPLPGVAGQAGARGEFVQRHGIGLRAGRAGQSHKAQGRAERHHVLGVREGDNVVGREPERGDEAFAQFGQEMQRPAEEGDLAPDGVAAGQPADGLFHHGLKDGGGEVFARDALVEQGHHVGLGEHAAAGRDGVQRPVARRQLVEPGGVGVQQGGHLIDERARAARAGLVHAQVHALTEIEDFGVFAAEFHRHVGLGGQYGDCPRGGDDFLYEGQAEGFGKAEGGRTGDCRENRHAGVAGGELVEHGGKRPADGGPVAHVLRFEQLSVRRDERELGGGRTDVQPQKHSLVHHASPYQPYGAGPSVGVPPACGRSAP